MVTIGLNQSSLTLTDPDPDRSGSSSGSINTGKTDIYSHYASVNQQTGIKAGDDGFQINVNGNTNLQGAVIASNDNAIKDNNNSLTTQTLSTEDINNLAYAKAESSGVSLSSNLLTQGKYGIAKALISNALDQAEEEQQAQSITLSAISQGNITITDEEKQKRLTGETAQETLQTLNKDTTNTHNELEKINHYTMEDRVEANRVIKLAVYQQAEKFTLESYRTLFLKDHPIYEVSRDKEGKRVLTKLTTEEARNLKKGSDGKVHIAANGIFNGKEGNPEAAGKYAEQHQTGDGPQYLIHFPEADNMVSELLIAGYMKFLENDFWGVSNSTVKFVAAGEQYGQEGLHLDGHSRGGMTIGNALEVLSNDENNNGQLSGTTINLFASAYNVNEADKLLADLQNRADLSPEQKQQAMIRYQSHEYDFVSRVLGQNPSTGGTAPEGSGRVQEWFNVMFGDDTVHNSYSTEQGRQAVSVNDDDTRALKKKVNKYWNSKLPKLVPVITIEY